MYLLKFKALDISIPLSAIVDTPASSLGHSLPSGWAEYAADGDYLIFLQAFGKSPPKLFGCSSTVLIKIDQDLSYISVFGEVSGQLNSARAVLQVIDILQGYQPCIGNPVGDFGPLVLAQGGVNDSSGIAYYFDVRDMIYY